MYVRDIPPFAGNGQALTISIFIILPAPYATIKIEIDLCSIREFSFLL